MPKPPKMSTDQLEKRRTKDGQIAAYREDLEAYKEENRWLQQNLEAERQIFQQTERKLKIMVTNLKEAMAAANTALQEGVAAANTALQEGVAARKEAAEVRDLFRRSGLIFLSAFLSSYCCYFY